jgi:transposase
MDKRRRYSAAFKAEVLAECTQPGASIARIAMAHGLNANMVHRWRRLAHGTPPPSVAAVKARRAVVSGEFMEIPVLAPAVPDSAQQIRIALSRAGTAVEIQWPASAAGHCAQWLRDWLR